MKREPVGGHRRAAGAREGGGESLRGGQTWRRVAVGLLLAAWATSCDGTAADEADIPRVVGARDGGSGGVADYLLHASGDAPGEPGTDGGGETDLPHVAGPDASQAPDLATAPDVPAPPGEDTGEPGPGPDHPLVECRRHEECPGAGDDPGVCCTRAVYQYHSFCSTLSECGAGGRDACLTDEQCAAREPSRPVCCHDRGFSHYCAPVPETCQPIEPCETFADCGNENRICCSRHEYYRFYVCTTSFLANSPEVECP